MKDADHKECCYGDDKSEEVHIVKEKPPSPQRGIIFIVFSMNHLSQCFFLKFPWGWGRLLFWVLNSLKYIYNVLPAEIKTIKRLPPLRGMGGLLQLTHLRKPVHHYIYYDICEGTCMELLHDVLAVRDSGGKANVELISYFFVDVALAQ